MRRLYRISRVPYVVKSTCRLENSMDNASELCDECRNIHDEPRRDVCENCLAHMHLKIDLLNVGKEILNLAESDKDILLRYWEYLVDKYTEKALENLSLSDRLSAETVERLLKCKIKM